MEGPTIAASIVEMKAARLGVSDPTRRWALLGPDGDAYFAGVTRPEGVALGDLEALQGVVKFPVRIKCATLAWNTLQQGLDEADV